MDDRFDDMESAIRFIIGTHSEWDPKLLDFLNHKVSRKILDKKPTTFYHCTHLTRLESILKHGIYHDRYPTMTNFLPGALIRAYQYQYNKNIQSVVVKIEMDYSLVDFVGFEEGEGDCYLPKETVDLNSITSQDILPSNLVERFRKGDKLWWIKPLYITEIVHTTKENYFEIFINDSDGI